MPELHLCGASAASVQSCPQQGTHQAHCRVHLIVAVQGFPQQLVQSWPGRHRQVLGLPHALGEVAVDVGLGEHQVFTKFLGEAMADVRLSRGAQLWGSAVGYRCLCHCQAWAGELNLAAQSHQAGALPHFPAQLTSKNFLQVATSIFPKPF